MYTIGTAINLALQTAEEKHSKGFLYKSDDDSQEQHDWSQGDPETVHSIISLYADDENNDGTWEEKISNALEEKYPEYF